MTIVLESQNQRVNPRLGLANMILEAAIKWFIEGMLILSLHELLEGRCLGSLNDRRVCFKSEILTLKGMKRILMMG